MKYDMLCYKIKEKDISIITIKRGEDGGFRLTIFVE